MRCACHHREEKQVVYMLGISDGKRLCSDKQEAEERSSKLEGMLDEVQLTRGI